MTAVHCMGNLLFWLEVKRSQRAGNVRHGLKRASLSRPSGPWSVDDFDVLADSVVVGRIFKAGAAPMGAPWMWTMLFDYCWPTHGYGPTREAATAAFAKSWGRSNRR